VRRETAVIFRIEAARGVRSTEYSAGRTEEEGGGNAGIVCSQAEPGCQETWNVEWGHSALGQRGSDGAMLHVVFWGLGPGDRHG
jgi:hypothetical protein